MFMYTSTFMNSIEIPMSLCLMCIYISPHIGLFDLKCDVIMNYDLFQIEL